jgi:N-acetylglucosaminyl-diphospho-decaprenol L-rhamnosyltransferase
MTAAAVLVVNFNGGGLLQRCLASVLGQVPPPAEVVVVDNASTDGSVAALPPAVRLVQRATNDGYGAAVNAGLAATRSPYVLTLNPDTELEPGCLAAAVAALHADHGLGAVAPRVLQAADPARLDATGIGLTSRFSQLNCDHGRLDAEVPAQPRPVLGPLGGAALWRRRALEHAGLFSETFFLYWEDVDVALRVNRAGYGCLTAPAARVRHHGSATIGRGSRTNVYYMVRNHAPCLLAALPGPLLRDRPHWLLLAPVRAAVLHAARGRPFTALAGLLCGWLLLPGAYLRRRRLPRTGTSRKAADRIAALMAAADENRLAMRAAGVTGGAREARA